MRILLDTEGIDVNAKCPKGQTALAYAKDEWSGCLTDMLLAAGAIDEGSPNAAAGLQEGRKGYQMLLMQTEQLKEKIGKGEDREANRGPESIADIYDYI